jgi:lipoprotein-anchoring transpeptidase ErfK/SrfK
LGVVALGLVAVLGVGGCQGGGAKKVDGGAAGAPSGSGSSSADPSSSAEASAGATVSPPAVVAFSPSKGAVKVRPDQQVQVTAQNATLTAVQVRSGKGVALAGELVAGGTAWHSSGVLSPGTSYTVSAQTQAPDGTTGTFSSDFATLRPSSTTSAVLIPGDDWTVGVGMPVVVQFGRAVKNRDAAVRTLAVSTTPEVEGAWHWVNDESVWWRPKDFWPAGTKVKVTAAIDGAELSPGVWGRRTYTSSFAIGSSIISTVDLAKHTMTVTKDGAVVRVLPVTGGKNDPRFRTRGGTKVIMEKLESVRMDATTTGTDPKDPEFYNTVEYWAMRLTWSGEYLHARPGSDWAFGKTNISHGCTGLSWKNAKWLFDFSKIGDVVKYTGSSRKLEFGNGYTAWDMSFAEWAAPSAA